MKPFIANPCNENWNAMHPDLNGRFCNSCNKTVIDFTQWDESRIADYLKNNAGEKPCGRFRQNQLAQSEVIMIDDKQLLGLNYSRLFVIALFVVFGATLFSCTDHANRSVKPKVELSNQRTLLGAPLIDVNADQVQQTETKERTTSEKKQKKEIQEDCIVPDITGEFMGPPALPPDEDTVLFVLGGFESIPEFTWEKGGIKEYIEEHLVYPVTDSALKGKVVVKFAVQRNGTLKDIVVVKSLRPDYDQAAIEVLSKMPRWSYPEHSIHNEIKMVLLILFSKK